MRGGSVACAGLLIGALLAGCDQAGDVAPTPLDGLHACDSADSVVGVFTALVPTPSPHDVDGTGFDTWVLDVEIGSRKLTGDGVHKEAVIAPDARTVYLGRSSGEIQGDSMAADETIERLDLATGATSVVARLPGIDDMSVSADGRWLAVSHYLGDAVGHGGISVVDLASEEVRVVPPAPDAERYPFVAVDAVGISPDGRQVAYAYVVEVEPNVTERTLRLQDVDSADHTILAEAPRLGHIADIAWSPDGETLIAAVRSLRDDRILRIDVATGATDRSDGFASYIAPITTDGTRLLGVTSNEDEQNTGGGSVTSWDGQTRVSAPLPVTPAASGVSIAACSYRR